MSSELASKPAWRRFEQDDDVDDDDADDGDDDGRHRYVAEYE